MPFLVDSVRMALNRRGLTTHLVIHPVVRLRRDGEGRVDMTVPMLFGVDTCEVGSDAGSPVSPDYGPKDNEFSGTVNWVQIDIDENAEDLDHLITPEERYKVAMARQ